MKFVNLTPHQINIIQNGQNFLTVKPSGIVARCSVERRFVNNVDGVELYTSQFGEVENLPHPQPDTMYIVSMLVRQALPERLDLASPGTLVRDDQGRPIGCEGLDINHQP